jgi:hypothetical protein
MREIYLGIIIILLILLVTLVTTNHCKQTAHVDEYLQGLWIADEDFCNDSEIDGMLIYIGPETEGYRRAYLIMYQNNAIIAEKKIHMHLSSYIPKAWFASDIYYNIHIKDADVSELDDDNAQSVSEIKLSSIMPNQMNLTLNLANGCMTWESDETVYAKLYKDNIASIPSNN